MEDLSDFELDAPVARHFPALVEAAATTSEEEDSDGQLHPADSDSGADEPSAATRATHQLGRDDHANYEESDSGSDLDPYEDPLGWRRPAIDWPQESPSCGDACCGALGVVALLVMAFAPALQHSLLP